MLTWADRLEFELANPFTGEVDGNLTQMVDTTMSMFCAAVRQFYMFRGKISPNAFIQLTMPAFHPIAKLKNTIPELKGLFDKAKKNTEGSGRCRCSH